MRILFPAILACAFTSPATSALAANDDGSVVRLDPNSEWALREFDDKCRISQSFGRGDRRTTLWMDKGGPGPGFNLTLIGDTMRHPFGANIRVSFVPEEPVERNYIKGTSSKGRPVISMFGVNLLNTNPAPKPVSIEASLAKEEEVDLTLGDMSFQSNAGDLEERLAAVSSLELSGAVIKPVSLNLEGIQASLQDLMRCAQELSERLERNDEISQEAGQAVSPQDQAKWVKELQKNYPLHLLREGEEAAIGVRLTINRAGKPSFCEVTASSGPQSFNDTACLLLMRHAKFKPAMNADGEPLPTFYETAVTYRINN